MQMLIAKEFYLALEGSNLTSTGTNLISITQKLFSVVVSTIIIVK